MPPVSPAPRHPRARTVADLIAAHIAAIGGAAAFADRHGIAINTAERIRDGRRPCPATLVDEVIAAIEADPIATLTERTIATELRAATAHRQPAPSAPAR